MAIWRLTVRSEMPLRLKASVAFDAKTNLPGFPFGRQESIASSVASTGGFSPKRIAATRRAGMISKCDPLELSADKASSFRGDMAAGQGGLVNAI